MGEKKSKIGSSLPSIKAVELCVPILLRPETYAGSCLLFY